MLDWEEKSYSEQIVNYVLKNNMYAIVNTHHDTSWIINDS
jgi:hypothetical protein